jgi:HK97 family phage major capsid protein
MKKFLEKLIAKKKAEAAELRAKIKEAQTADEVRALGDTLQGVLDDLKDAEAQLADAEDEGEGNGAAAGEGEAASRSANPMHAFRSVANYGGEAAETGDRTDSVEYRTAFMNFVCRNEPIPMELRADEVTGITDVSAVIPTTLMHQIVRELGTYGDIYARVRSMQVQGGIEIPVADLKPVATWITANTGTSESDTQKLTAKDTISFKYFGLECKVAQTLLVSITTLEVFQNEFVKLASEAMVRAIEQAIFNGTGAGMPTGILTDTRVPDANVLTLTAEQFASWNGWKKGVFAKMKKAYRNGSFIMAQGTFDGYIDGMVDKNGQPIGRVNYGITDGEAYRFGGKEVLTVENDILPDYDSASAGDVVAVFVKLGDYAINKNMEMQVVKWTDHDTNTLKTKAILVCDGKLIDPNGVLIIKKG